TPHTQRRPTVVSPAASPGQYVAVQHLLSSAHTGGKCGSVSRLPGARAVRSSPGVDQALHGNEIPIDVELVRTLVGRVMPDYADAPVRRLESSGSTNVLFRL